MQDFDIVSSEGLFLLCTLLKVLRQGVSSSISFALTIVNLEVVIREFLGPADWFGIQTLCIHKPVKVVMVGKHKDSMLGALEIVPPGLESFNNG